MLRFEVLPQSLEIRAKCSGTAFPNPNQYFEILLLSCCIIWDNRDDSRRDGVAEVANVKILDHTYNATTDIATKHSSSKLCIRLRDHLSKRLWRCQVILEGFIHDHIAQDGGRDATVFPA